jgi:undecaprenyl-diphosphatase
MTAPPPATVATVERSPADVLRLAVAAALLLVLLVVQWLFGETLVSFAAELFSGLSAIPAWIIETFVVAIRVTQAVLLAAGVLWVGRRRSGRVVVTVAVAAVAAAALAALLDWVADVDAARAVVDLGGWGGPLTTAGYPTAVGVAVMVAVLTAGAPWASRTYRRAAWAAMLGVTLVHFLVTPIAFDSVRAFLVGWLAGAAALVALGAPSRRPTVDGIAEGLARVGVPLRTITAASVDARGSTPYFAEAADGSRLFVKALSVDQRSADLLFRVYRRVQRHQLGDERPFSSLRRTVEHEALVALAVRDLGIRTPRLRAFSSAEPASFVLAYDAIDGRSLDRLEPAELTDEVLAGIWAQVVRLREHRVAHRDLRLANIFLAADGEVWMIDFGFSELAASDLLLANDVAELVASSSLLVGVPRAVDHARGHLDAAGLAAAAERLHPWALSGATRTGLAGQPGVLDALRARLADPSIPERGSR